jgi:hypothetical protein
MKYSHRTFQEIKEELIEQGHTRCYEPWSNKEDEDLTRRFKGGESISSISKEFERTYGAIRSRLVKLELLDLETKKHSTPIPESKKTVWSKDAYYFCEQSVFYFVNDPWHIINETEYTEVWDIVDDLIEPLIQRLDIKFPDISPIDHWVMIELYGVKDGIKKTELELAKQFEVSVADIAEIRMRICNDIMSALFK